MPEKPTNEPLAVLYGQSAVDIEILLEIGEGAFNLVVSIRHPQTVLPLECEQVRQVEINTMHRRAKPLMSVMAAASPLRHAAAVDDVGVVRLPFQVLPDESLLVRVGDCEDHTLQFPGRLEPRILSEIPADDAYHMEVAHLYRVSFKLGEQASHSVNDDTLDAVSPILYRRYCRTVILHGLVPYEFKIEDRASEVVYRKQDTPIAPPIGSIDMDVSTAVEHGLLPFHVNHRESSPDCGTAYSVCLRQLLHGLFPVQVHGP